MSRGAIVSAQARERMQKLIEEINRIEETNGAKVQRQSLDRVGKEETQRLQDIMR